ncbi:MAG: metalloregulator ArsR/SmtB family transcription factor [Actinomycetia bacterium]|nr:metalloregulator ArsR/SmtB family transcription factor [Actinomycetes bacterium]
MNIRSDEPSIDDGCCRVSEHHRSAVESALAQLPDTGRLKRASDVLGAFGDPTRLRIVLALTVCELCVCDLAVVAKVSESAVSHQLRLLRNLDLVAFRRDGKRAVYRLADDHVRVLLEQALSHAGESEGAK